MGYITPRAGAIASVVQPERALLMIRLLIGPIPALLLIVGILIGDRLPMTKEQDQQTLAKLAQRKENRDG